MSNVQTPAASAPDKPPLNVTPSQRAAVVVAMLGETAAKPIIDRLDDHAIVNIANSLESINYLAREQLIEIVIDFLRQLRQSSGSMRGSPESAKEFMSSVLDEPRLNVIYGGGEPPPLEEQVPEPENKEDYSRLWQKFAAREPAQTVKYLSGLTPNIIGLILRNVDATLCAELICRLDEELQTKVLGEMVDPPPPSYEIDSVVARMVRMEFLLVPEDEEDDTDAHLQTLGEMLSLMPNERRASLMDYVSKSHAGKVDPIQKGMFEISDIPVMLNRNQVPVLFKEIDQATMLEVMSCLQRDYDEVAKYFLSNISNRMADSMKDELERMKAPNEEAAEEILKNFLMKMMSFKKDGIITLERPEPEDDE
ncbi:MAG: FliG C-terminal domain-containing protein [Pseudomonadota bacterium]